MSLLEAMTHMLNNDIVLSEFEVLLPSGKAWTLFSPSYELNITIAIKDGLALNKRQRLIHN